MDRKTWMFGVGLLLTTVATTSLAAQVEQAEANPLIASARDANDYLADVLTKAADQMSEEDYAFKPTPEVRSFGQLLAHIADSNYMFCSAARGEEPPVRGVEGSIMRRVDIHRVLAQSFAYCRAAYAGLTEARARSMVSFMGEERPVLACCSFPRTMMPLRQRHHVHAAQGEGAAVQPGTGQVSSPRRTREVPRPQEGRTECKK